MPSRALSGVIPGALAQASVRLPRVPAHKSQTPTLVAPFLGDLCFPAITSRYPALSEQCKDHQIKGQRSGVA